MPQQSKKRIAQLLREYPILQEIYSNAAELAKLHGCEFDTIIKVKRGNPNLMFRQANDALGNGMFIGKPGDASVLGTCVEYYRPVNRSGELGNVRDWRSLKDHYVRDLFQRPCYDWNLLAVTEGKDPFETIDKIVWVTEEKWYPEKNSDMINDRTRPIHMNLWITIYKEPKKGWHELYRTADPQINVDLHSWQLMAGPNFQDSFRDVIYDRLNRLAQEFQQKVWNDGFGTIVDSSSARGMSGMYGDVRVLTYIIAGRLRLQFERRGAMLNFAGLDEVGDPRLSFGSIDSKLPQAEKMVRDVIKFWENADEETRQNVHQDDTNVGLGL